jgi:hypothetical protein
MTTPHELTNQTTKQVPVLLEIMGPVAPVMVRC